MMSTTPAGTVIVGGGQAAVEAAFTLRKQGYEDSLTLICDEPFAPYQRPPLSKTYLMGKSSQDDLRLRPLESYDEARIDLILGRRALGIDRLARVVELDGGSSVRYDNLLLAVGGRPRELPVLSSDPPFDNVFYVRSIADVDQLRQVCVAGQRLAIVGGGYIGLEVAAAGVSMGLDVTVVEAMPRVLARVTAAHMSSFYESVHRGNGVRILTDASVAGCVRHDGSHAVRELVLHTGDVLPADIVVVGIGLIPNIELAADAGLVVDNGIVVDRSCRTSDPHIFAAGDCTVHPSPQFEGALVRIESVSNAVEQGRTVARAIMGEDATHDAIPWFWSDQYDLKLQMVGQSSHYERSVVRGDPGERSFATFYIDTNDIVVGADVVNRPADFLWSRRLVAARVRPPTAALEDLAVPLKSLLPE